MPEIELFKKSNFLLKLRFDFLPPVLQWIISTSLIWFLSKLILRRTINLFWLVSQKIIFQPTNWIEFLIKWKHSQTFKYLLIPAHIPYI